jgi:hypothetical protein
MEGNCRPCSESTTTQSRILYGAWALHPPRRAEHISHTSIHFHMKERLPIRAGASILAVFIIGVCGVVPAGALYWLMRPTVLPNPGVNAYRPPKPDSTFPRIVRDTRDPHTLSIAVAGEGARRLDLTTGVQQRRQRTVRANTLQKQPSSPARAPGAPVISWANRDHSFGTWYR